MGYPTQAIWAILSFLRINLILSYLILSYHRRDASVACSTFSRRINLWILQHTNCSIGENIRSVDSMCPVSICSAWRTLPCGWAPYSTSLGCRRQPSLACHAWNHGKSWESLWQDSNWKNCGVKRPRAWAFCPKQWRAFCPREYFFLYSTCTKIVTLTSKMKLTWN